MNSEPLLNYEPQELSFQLEQNKELLSYIRLLNNTDDYVAFKLKSTKPRNYAVRPKIGILLPRSTCEIQVRAVGEATQYMRRKDKFMIQSAVAAPATTVEDARILIFRGFETICYNLVMPLALKISRKEILFMIVLSIFTIGAIAPENEFDRDSRHPFQESILRVVYSRSREPSPSPLPSPSTSTSTSTPVFGDIDPPAPQVPDSVEEPCDTGSPVTSSVTEPDQNDLLATDHVTQSQVDASGLQSPVIEDNPKRSFLTEVINNCTSESILREIIRGFLILGSLYLMKPTISWIWSLVMFVIMLVIKMIKKLVSDSVEDWIVKTLVHIFMFLIFGRNTTTQP